MNIDVFTLWVFIRNMIMIIGNLKCVCSYVSRKGRTSLTHALEGPHSFREETVAVSDL